MPAPYSKDLRERVVRLYRKGTLTYDEVAQLLGVGRASVSRYLRLERESGSVAPKPAKGGAAARLGDASREAVSELVTAHPDKTLEELNSLWTEAHPDLAVRVRTLGRVVRAAGFTRKKSPPRVRGRARRSSPPAGGVRGVGPRPGPRDIGLHR